MRTTLTLDDDVAAKLKKAMERQKLSLKEVVNSTLRRGLAAQALAEERGKRPFKVKTFSGEFCSGVDLLHLNQLNDELEPKR